MGKVIVWDAELVSRVVCGDEIMVDMGFGTLTACLVVEANTLSHNFDVCMVLVLDGARHTKIFKKGTRVPKAQPIVTKMKMAGNNIYATHNKGGRIIGMYLTSNDMDITRNVRGDQNMLTRLEKKGLKF